MSNTIYNVVVSIINEVTGIDPESITLDSHIVDDLQIDSFAATEILGRFEEEFNITINANDFIGVYIISDIVDTLVELGATFDDSNIESYADTSDTAYLATENDIFSNGSKRVLTYKNMLDLMYDQLKYFKVSSSINSIAPYSTESFLSYGSATSAYSTNVHSFTIKTSANNYKNFNTGLTHFASSATMTITMSINLSYAPISYTPAINVSSDDGDETNYNVSPASLDFDNEGTQTSSVEDTGVAYTDNTMANTPNLMSVSNNSGPIDETLNCETNISCGTTVASPCNFQDTSGQCNLTPTFSIYTGCETPSYGETSFCAETSLCSETSGCLMFTVASCSATQMNNYHISYKATVYPIGSNTEITSITATFSTTDIFSSNNLSSSYLRIPTKQYFAKTSTNTNQFGFRIEIIADTDYIGYHLGYTIANSTITYNRPSYYVFNPNNKTVRYATANNLYTNYTQS